MGTVCQHGLKQHLSALVDELDRIYSGEHSSNPSITEELKGFPGMQNVRNGCLTVVAGLPCSGRTELLARIVWRLAVESRQWNVAYLTLQERPEKFLLRLIAQSSASVHNHIPVLREDDWQGLIDAVDVLRDAPVHMIDGVALDSWRKIQDQLEYLSSDHALDLVLIDDWTLDSVEKLGIAAADLKRLAVNLDVPVIVTAPIDQESIDWNILPEHEINGQADLLLATSIKDNEIHVGVKWEYASDWKSLKMVGKHSTDADQSVGRQADVATSGSRDLKNEVNFYKDLLDCGVQKGEEEIRSYLKVLEEE